MMTARKLFILAIFFGCHAHAIAQSPESRLLKAEMDSLAQRLSKIHAGQQVMSKRADSVAQAISRIKAKQPSPLEARSLNDAYRTSQLLADSLQSLQSKAQSTDRRLRQKAESLLKNLNAEMLSLAEAKSAAQKKNDRQTSQQLNTELQSCRQWQRFCQEILEEPPPPVLIYEVRVEPDDDARTLQRKADFLRDQADRVERELRAFEQKLAALREESELRNRMQEFSQDLALLDPTNEGLRAAGSAADNKTISSESGAGDFAASRAALEAASTVAIDPLISFNWPGNVSDLSDQDLREWQKRMQQWRARRQTQADSLRRRAEDFEKLARVKEE